MKIEDLIKKIILSFLFIPFFSYSNPCEFKAKVTPIEFTERVESIYKDMCEWYVSTFPDNPLNPEIILNDIKFVDSWDKIDYVKDSNELSGVYYAMVEKEREFKEIKGFKRIAHIMYQMAPSVYLYNSVIWFDDNPQLKLSNLVDGVYTLHEMSYR